MWFSPIRGNCVCLLPLFPCLQLQYLFYFFSCLQQGTINLKHSQKKDSQKKEKSLVLFLASKFFWLNLFLEEHLCSAKSELPALWHQGSVSRCRQSRLLAATSKSRAKPGEPRRKMMGDRTSLPLSITLCLQASHAAPLRHALATLTPAHGIYTNRMGAPCALSSTGWKWGLLPVLKASSPSRSPVLVVHEV